MWVVQTIIFKQVWNIMRRVNSEPLILAEWVTLISFDDVSNIFTPCCLVPETYMWKVCQSLCVGFMENWNVKWLILTWTQSSNNYYIIFSTEKLSVNFHWCTCQCVSEWLLQIWQCFNRFWYATKYLIHHSFFLLNAFQHKKTMDSQ